MQAQDSSKALFQALKRASGSAMYSRSKKSSLQARQTRRSQLHRGHRGEHREGIGTCGHEILPCMHSKHCSQTLCGPRGPPCSHGQGVVPGSTARNTSRTRHQSKAPHAEQPPPQTVPCMATSVSHAAPIFSLCLCLPELMSASVAPPQAGSFLHQVRAARLLVVADQAVVVRRSRLAGIAWQAGISILANQHQGNSKQAPALLRTPLTHVLGSRPRGSRCTKWAVVHSMLTCAKACSFSDLHGRNAAGEGDETWSSVAQGACITAAMR